MALDNTAGTQLMGQYQTEAMHLRYTLLLFENINKAHFHLSWVLI